MNFLLITADDMNYDAPGCFGCRTPNITPNLDRLAAEGMRFETAHVTIAVCQPSRQCLMTGRYPFRNGGEGFFPIDDGVPTLQELLHEAGYLNGIIGKVTHLAPKRKFMWDYDVDFEDLYYGRSPQRYRECTDEFLTQARQSGKPFFLMANSHDPHRPFAGSDDEKKRWGETLPYSRRIREDEIDVPGFLPDLPDVRQEVAEYYTSVHRCDESIGQVLEALTEHGFADDTIVMFLSDNGMAFPFAKTNCYLASTKTPWIVRWPGVVEPGRVERERMINGIDFMPTILEITGVNGPQGLDGRSFKSLLDDDRNAGRDVVFTEFHETAAKRRYPMRCVQSPEYGYIANFWSDGDREFRNESQSGLTFSAMAAAGDSEIADRVDLFVHRVPEEFYDMKNDPCCLRNLIDEPELQEEVERYRQVLAGHLDDVGDPAYPAFSSRLGEVAVARFMAEQEGRSAEAAKKRR